MSLRERIRSDKKTRVRLLRGLAGLAALLLLVVLPAYLSSLPGFFGRYPALETQHGEWMKSTHLGVGCKGCHVPPKPLARASYHARMVGEFYVSTVFRDRTPGLFATPENSACLDCHSELRTSSPKGDLQIPHRAHITILGMNCVQCHEYLVHEPNPDGKHAPTMRSCLTCHDGDMAKDACTACHTQKAAPASHTTPDWLVAHAEQAENPECVTCHKWTQDWCADCHADRPVSHGVDWRAVHGERVAEHRSCEACHEQDFCVRCHGEIPMLNYDPDRALVK